MILHCIKNCELCDDIKGELQKAGVPYEEKDFDTLLENDPMKASEILEASHALVNRKIFPMIEVDGKYFPPSFARKIVRSKTLREP